MKWCSPHAYGEALGLRWQDIDFERRVLTVNRILERIGRGQGSTLQLVEPKTSARAEL